VLYGREYWNGLLKWIRDRPLYEEKISPEDLDLLTVTDDVDTACNAILESRKNREAREARRADEKASVQATAEARQQAASGSRNAD
jgi:predicted Rossmann-fold nucleotide-binding protein